MRTDLLQSLQILTKLAVYRVRQNLTVLAIHDIALSIEKPCWDLVLKWALDDCDYTFEFFGGEVAGAVISSSIREQFEVVVVILLCGFQRTAYSNPHPPSCRPSCCIGDRHP